MNNAQLSIDLTDFRDVPGYEKRYKVSEDGRVYSVRSRRLLHPSMMNNPKGRYSDLKPYYTIVLHKDGHTRTWMLHKLVAAAFLEKSEISTRLTFKDGNTLNVHASNLKWMDKTKQSELESIKNADR